MAAQAAKRKGGAKPRGKAKPRTATLYAAKGGGSMIVEAAYALAGKPLKVVDIDWSDTGWHSRALKKLNPLGQVPTLRLPDGAVMTESAAILIHLAETSPKAKLMPPAGAKDRARFLRWLVFLVSAIYPTFTYGDDPKRWLDGDETAGKKLRAGTDEHRKMLWRFVERHAGMPWFLGKQFSLLDLYLMPMTWWRPGYAWFEAECPKLHAIGQRVQKLPKVAPVRARQDP